MAINSATEVSPAEKKRIYRKVALRLMPLLVICYFISFIDRTNIGIAQIGLERDLGFSEAVYALGVSCFFIGFIIFEIPSNALMSRIGARKTIVRIMMLWGLVTIATMFITGPVTFYIARFFLGVAEAGFFPGCLLFLSYWFPSSRRTGVTAIFFMAIPISGAVGSAMSGWIMSAFGGVAGLADWQWLFIIEGIPPLILAGIAWLSLCDRPSQAVWLSDVEKAVIERDLADDSATKGARSESHGGLRVALRDPRVWILGLGACAAYTFANAVSFWTPRIIHRSGIDDPLSLGLLSAIPPIGGIIVMLLVGGHSDRTRERRWHTAVPWLTGVATMFILAFTLDTPPLVVVLLTVMACAHYSGLTVFYSIPSIYLSPRTAATGIAFVTAAGSVMAAVAPAMLAAIQVITGDISVGLMASGLIILCGVFVVLIGIPARSLREADTRLCTELNADGESPVDQGGRGDGVASGRVVSGDEER
ncbi:MFS transporter [Brevibacterium sp. K11IcPPYGO002]|uniref:MFS transporter n=1 Tax=Brevibacterium sp. K11IcPPYGO002 TaxID=3058837 RepID=UPI003D817DF8